MRQPRSAKVRRLLLAMALLGGCGRNVVDAVGLDTCDRDPSAAGCQPVIWPNEISLHNSDEWLVAHHDRIVELRPKVLVLQFHETTTVEGATARAERLIDAIAEGSRYHAYSYSEAPPMLRYQLAGVVDLADHPVPPGWTNPSSTLVPVGADGSFDETALFTAEFADRVGIADPLNPSRNLTMCELFERGVVNEVWLMVGEAGVRAPELVLSRKQIYDDAGRPVPSLFDKCIGAGCLEVSCSVTVRLAHLSPDRGVGCDLEVRGWELGSLGRAVPYLDRNATAFFNADFRSRFGTRFDSWDEICDRLSTRCVTYPTQDSATGTYADGTTWTMSPFLQGCGDTEFPPNATFRWDVTNASPVLSRCEHYGMRDGSDGNDLREPYSAMRIAGLQQTYGGDCAGGWQIYLRQSIPGLRNTAVDDGNQPMKAWWPYLFY